MKVQSSKFPPARRRWPMWAGVLVCALALLTSHRSLHAELTATVSPGWSFVEGDIPTVDHLNLLGIPSITIQGTVDGSTGLSAKSVSGDLMSDSLASSNIIFNAASPRGLTIADGGVHPNQINADIAGAGLAGGSGTALSVNVDGLSIQLIGDTLYDKTKTGYFRIGGTNDTGTNGLPSSSFTISGGNVSLTTFNSGEYALANGLIMNTNHSLGAAPVLVRPVLVCKTADLNYAPGDEIDLANTGHVGSDAAHAMWGANATNVWLTLDNSGGFQVFVKDTGAGPSSITDSRWRLKIYARP